MSVKLKNAQRCCECGKMMERCRPVNGIHIDGKNMPWDWTCRRCWDRLEYALYMYEKDKI